MKDRIQSWASILVGAAVVVLIGWITLEQLGRPRIHAELDAGGNPSVSANGGDAGAAVLSSVSNGDSGTGTGTGTGTMALGAIESGDGGISLFNTLMGDAGAMPSGAPRSVRLGVVLVQFVGAEGAPSSARAKPDALKHALELADQAKADWKAAVRSGDSGSSEDIGRIPRGVLDRATEVAVFSLSAGDISEPLETPRGYWVVKRTE